MRGTLLRTLFALGALMVSAGSALAQLSVPGQGFDGSLNITTTTTIDLSQAVDGDWDVLPTDPDWSAGDGIYDASQWAIVFHYTDVTIASGATLKFTNHPSGAPIVWLVTGAVDVAGTLSVVGESGGSLAYVSDAGPGGFRGGNGNLLGVSQGSGFGPGGAPVVYGADASYATVGSGNAPTYGNDEIIPLIGGSGGAGWYSAGGAGGGAVLIAATGDISIDGTINARGGVSGSGGGHGSGGAVRLVSPRVIGAGSILASAGGAGGGDGRIRIEYTLAAPNLPEIFPSPSLANLGASATAQIWPLSTDPSIRVVSLNGVLAPSDPEATLAFPWQDVALDGGDGDVTVVVEGTNVPSNAAVTVFLTQVGGAGVSPQPATLVATAGSITTWEYTFTGITNGIAAVQARAVLP